MMIIYLDKFIPPSQFYGSIVSLSFSKHLIFYTVLITQKKKMFLINIQYHQNYGQVTKEEENNIG